MEFVGGNKNSETSRTIMKIFWCVAALINCCVGSNLPAFTVCSFCFNRLLMICVLYIIASFWMTTVITMFKIDHQIKLWCCQLRTALLIMYMFNASDHSSFCDVLSRTWVFYSNLC